MVRTDRGTENTLIAACSACFLRGSHSDDHASLKAHNPYAHGPYTSNQRIEILDNMVDEYLFTNGRMSGVRYKWWFTKKLFVVLLQQASTTRSRSGMYKLGYPLHKKFRYNTQAGDVGARNCKIPTVNEDIIPPCKHTFTTNHKTTMI
jgi:hypothetical protein